jgi:hypothetical protein
VSEDAVSGLIGQVPPFLMILIGILGFLSLISSYIVIGLNVRRVFQFDFGMPESLSKILVVVLPPLFYLAGFRGFLNTVIFVGTIFMPLEGIFIILMWLKANKKLTMPPILVSEKVKFLIPVVLVIFAGVLINGILTR